MRGLLVTAVHAIKYEYAAFDCNSVRLEIHPLQRFALFHVLHLVLTIHVVLCSHGTDEVLSPDVYQPLIEQLDQGASFFSSTLMISPLLPLPSSHHLKS